MMTLFHDIATHVQAAKLGRAFFRNKKGTAAVEFAFILPLMIMLYWGAVQIYEATSVNRRVNTVASSVADLVTQVSEVDDAALARITDIAEGIMTPYDDANLTIAIASYVKSGGNVVLDWSYGGSVSLTAEAAALLENEGDSIIAVEVGNSFSPTLGKLELPLAGGRHEVGRDSYDQQASFYLRPRTGACIKHPDSVVCGS